MDWTGTRIGNPSRAALDRAVRSRVGLLLVIGALGLGGCYVVPAGYPVAQRAYVSPAPVYVAPAPVYVAPAPVYVWGGYGWRRHGRW